MILDKVVLKNIKSYVDGEFTFRKGVNFIKGNNGVGKSTLIEAIGYALFNVTSTGFDLGINEYLLRYGEKSGLVQVYFTGKDGKKYKVERTVNAKKAANKWLIYEGDMEQPLPITQEKDKEYFLIEAIGETQQNVLPMLFSDIIGIRQGEFKAPFSYSNAQRKEYFNRIFGVSDYEKTSKRMLEAQKILKGKIDTLSSNIDIFRENVQKDAHKKDELKVAKKNLTALGEEIKKLEAEKQQVDARLQEIQALSQRIQTWEQQQKKLEEQMSQQKVQWAGLAKEKEMAQESRRIVQQNQQGYEKMVALEQQQKQLEEEKSKLDQLQKEQLQLQGEQKAALGRLEEWERSYQQRKEDIAKRQTIGQQELEHVKREIREIQNHIEEQRQSLEKETHRLTGLEQMEQGMDEAQGQYQRQVLAYHQQLKRIKEEGKEAREIAQTLPLCKQRWEEWRGKSRQRDDLRQQKSTLMGKQEELRKNQDSLSRGICPFYESNCPLPQQEAQVEQKLEELAVQVSQLSLQEKDLEAWLSQNEDAAVALSEAQKGAKRLEEKKTEYKKVLGAAQQVVQEIWKQLAKLPYEQAQLEQALPKEPPKKSGELAEYMKTLKELVRPALDQARNDHLEQNKSLAAQQKELEKAIDTQARLQKEQENLQLSASKLEDQQQEMEEERQNLEGYAQKLKEIDGQLTQFAGVEQELEKIKEEMQQYRPAYDLYREHKNAAEKVETLEEKLYQLEAESEEQQAELEKCKKEMEALRQQFSQEELEQTQQKINTLHSQLGEKNAIMDSTQAERQRLEREVAQWMELKAKLHQAEEQKRTSQKAVDILAILRRTLEQSGASITDILRKNVNRYAVGIYKSLQHTADTLVWTRSYDAQLVDWYQGKSRVRSFRQLSGGQKMSAALAIRLSLLKCFSHGKIVFLDEPTEYMDAQSRENLADLLKGVLLGFDQVFVISHNDTFDKLTENIVEINKGSNGSEIIYG